YSFFNSTMKWTPNSTRVFSSLNQNYLMESFHSARATDHLVYRIQVIRSEFDTAHQSIQRQELNHPCGHKPSLFQTLLYNCQLLLNEWMIRFYFICFSGKLFFFNMNINTGRSYFMTMFFVSLLNFVWVLTSVNLIC